MPVHHLQKADSGEGRRHGFWPGICKLQLDSEFITCRGVAKLPCQVYRSLKDGPCPSLSSIPVSAIFFNNPNFKKNKHLLSTNHVSPPYCPKSQELVPLSRFISLDAILLRCTASRSIPSPRARTFPPSLIQRSWA